MWSIAEPTPRRGWRVCVVLVTLVSVAAVIGAPDAEAAPASLEVERAGVSAGAVHRTVERADRSVTGISWDSGYVPGGAVAAVIRAAVIALSDDEGSLSLLDKLQALLDVAGIVFDPIDLVNAAISILRGEWGAAALSAVALVPVAGAGTLAAKGRVAKLADEVPFIRSLLNRNSPIRQLRNGDKLAAMDEAVGYTRLADYSFSGKTWADSHMTYATDGFGRTESVTGVLSLDRYGTAPPSKVRQTMHEIGDAGDEAGHLLGRQFGGSGQPHNMVPQSHVANRSVMKHYETAWRHMILRGHTIEVDIRPIYWTNSARPSEIRITWKLDGQPQDLVVFPNNRVARYVFIPPTILALSNGTESTENREQHTPGTADSQTVSVGNRGVRISWGSDASGRGACPSGRECRNLQYEYFGDWGPAPYTLECWSNGGRGWVGRWSGRAATGCFYWGGTAQVVIDGVRSNQITFGGSVPSGGVVSEEPVVATDPVVDRGVRISWGSDASGRGACPSGRECRNLQYEYFGDWGPAPYTLECWSNGGRGWVGRWSGRAATGCFYWGGTAQVVIDGVRSNQITF